VTISTTPMTQLTERLDKIAGQLPNLAELAEQVVGGQQPQTEKSNGLHANGQRKVFQTN
jgi:hypothetical protein